MAEVRLVLAFWWGGGDLIVWAVRKGGGVREGRERGEGDGGGTAGLGLLGGDLIVWAVRERGGRGERGQRERGGGDGRGRLVLVIWGVT